MTAKIFIRTLRSAAKPQPKSLTTANERECMRNYILQVSFAALLMVGCAHREHPTSVPARTVTATPRTAPTPVVIGGVSNTLITTFGQQTVGGTWTVRISEEDRTVEVTNTRLFEGGSSITTLNPSGWRAEPGWFVFIENDQRLWAYDGDRNLLLFEFTGTPSSRVSCLSGPTNFGCPVPEAVLRRLSDAARKAIKRI